MCHPPYLYVFLFGFGFVNCLIVCQYYLLRSSNEILQQNKYVQADFESAEMNNFCFRVQQRIEDEKRQTNTFIPSAVPIKAPNFTNETEQQSKLIPYRYSDWNSSPDLPRRMTPCEHQLYTELLRIVDHFFRRHSISYMIVDGTLVGKYLNSSQSNRFSLPNNNNRSCSSGSYTHHDFLPWDDDVDIRAPNKDRWRMLRLLRQELYQTIAVIHVEHEEYGGYDKIYFPWAPRAGRQIWTYPFIDIGYYDENDTHIWQANYGFDSIDACSLSKENIFPLVWRPFGEIWLPVSFFDEKIIGNLPIS